jgi:hypothetical protein
VVRLLRDGVGDHDRLSSRLRVTKRRVQRRNQIDSRARYVVKVKGE